MTRPSEEMPRYPLRSIYFYPTESCNLKCIHCWIRPAHAPDHTSYQKQNEENLTVEVMEQVVRDALPLGLSNIKFTGGEPFLNPALFEFIEMFARYGLSLGFETNGTLLSKSIVERLSEYDLGLISVSLDGGAPELHEKIRGVKGSFKKAVEAIQLLIEHQIYPQVIFCLQKINADDLENTIRLAYNMKVKSFEINPLALVGPTEPSMNACEGLSIEELLDLEDRVENEYTSRYPNMHIDLYLPPALKGNRVLARDPLCTCTIFNICGILSNGDVSICGIGRRKKDLIMGNVKETGIAEIWEEGKLFREIREKVPFRLKGVCSTCLFKHHCLGFCRADVLCDEQSLLSPNELCQEAFQKGRFPESRLLAENELSKIHGIRSS